MARMNRMFDIVRDYRHAYLLVALLLLIVVRPFVDATFGSRLIEVLLYVTVVMAAYATARSRESLIALGSLALATIAMRSQAEHDPRMLTAFFVTAIALFTLVAGALVQSLFRKGLRISLDTLYGSISAYLLLGLVWSMAYTLLDNAIPGSFLVNGEILDPDSGFERFLGFSFTTLTTLGYGNIAPATPRADALTSLEAIVGQVYVAVVIARLVALQLAQEIEGVAPADARD